MHCATIRQLLPPYYLAVDAAAAAAAAAITPCLLCGCYLLPPPYNPRLHTNRQFPLTSCGAEKSCSTSFLRRVTKKRKMSVNVIIIGPPGSGVRTQAQRLARRRPMPILSSGVLIRDAVADAHSPLGKRARLFLDAGKVSPPRCFASPNPKPLTSHLHGLLALPAH